MTRQGFLDAIQLGNLVFCTLVRMPFQGQDVTQGLACVGQLTLQRSRLFRGAFLVQNHVAFQPVQKQLHAFFDAGQLRQGLLLS